MASGESSPEYKALQELNNTLRVGVQTDLTRIATEAFAGGLLGADERDDVLDDPRPNHRKAATLIQIIQTKVHVKPGCFRDFRDILNRETAQRHLVKQLDDRLAYYKEIQAHEERDKSQKECKTEGKDKEQASSTT